jgi:Tfp pilus assembly protein PilV
MALNQNFKNQSGMSLAEALMAVVISTIVMGTAYFIYKRLLDNSIIALLNKKLDLRFIHCN